MAETAYGFTPAAVPADPASGNGWENQALFDYSGRLLLAAAVYR